MSYERYKIYLCTSHKKKHLNRLSWYDFERDFKLLLKFYCNKQAKTQHCVLCPGTTGFNARAVQLTVHIPGVDKIYTKKRGHILFWKLFWLNVNVLEIKKNFQIWCWRSRIFKDFEIITVIFSNNERTEYFFNRVLFICYWRFLTSNAMEQLKCN